MKEEKDESHGYHTGKYNQAPAERDIFQEIAGQDYFYTHGHEACCEETVTQNIETFVLCGSC